MRLKRSARPIVADFSAKRSPTIIAKRKFPRRKIHSLRWHPVRLLSFLDSPYYYGAKKKYLDWIAARHLATGRYDLFHSWSGDCLLSLREAHKRGIPSIVEIPTWHRDRGKVKRGPTGASRETPLPWRERWKEDLLIGVASFALFLWYETRAPEPMLELRLFSRRNFAIGNLETLTMYAAIAVLFFYLTIYLQEVAGFTALESGLTTVPVTLVMFALSRRFGALADRYGPRLFMGAGPLVAAVGVVLLGRVGRDVSYLIDLLPALLLFALGLSLTVAPLTAAVLADAAATDAGIASAVNNAVARVAGLIGVSLVGIIVAGSLIGDSFAANDESMHAFHHVMWICAALLAAAGVTGATGIVNPRKPIMAEECAGGQFVGAPLPAATTRTISTEPRASTIGAEIGSQAP